MMPSLATITAICAAFLADVSNLIAADGQPLTYFRTVPVETAAVWKACLEETKESQGYRIESSHNPYVLWLFFDFGNPTHPISELTAYAYAGDIIATPYGIAAINSTLQTINPDRTRLSATRFFQLIDLPTSAAYVLLC